MARRLSPKRSLKVGLPPGTPLHIGERKVDQTRITVIVYDPTHVEEFKPDAVEGAVLPTDRTGVTWINVDGLHEVDVLSTLGEQFGLHPLVVEDILNTEQRPKMEDYGEYFFVTLKSFYPTDEQSREPESEQISLVLGPNYVLSFQERGGNEFDLIRNRIRTNKGRVRKAGADYLAYALIDLIVDQYFVVLESFGDRIESLEGELIADPATETLHALHHLKREMAHLRKSMWPLRQVVSSLERSESLLIHEPTRLYLRDVYDHTIQVIDAVETFRDMLSGMLDIYLSSVSNRMNEVMKVLTIISTVFIPLTFVAGIYGMNFQHMPELSWPWAYPLVWLVMVVIAVLMVVYFRRKRWL
jgi:magnesium transporter